MAVYKLTTKNKKKNNYNTKKTVGIILIAISSICFLFLATNLIPFIRTFLFGILGWFSFPLCIISFIIGLALLNNKKYVMPVRYAVYLSVVVLCVLCILQIACIGSNSGLSFGQYLGKNYTSKINPSGIIVGLITTIVVYLTTIWGAYVIFSALLALFIGLFIDCINQLKKSSKMSAPIKVKMNEKEVIREKKEKPVKVKKVEEENINIVLDAKIQEEVDKETQAKEMLGLLRTTRVDRPIKQIEEPVVPQKLEGEELRRILLTPVPPKIEVTQFVKENKEVTREIPSMNPEIQSNFANLKNEEKEVTPAPSQIVHEYEFMSETTPMIRRNLINDNDINEMVSEIKPSVNEHKEFKQQEYKQEDVFEETYENFKPETNEKSESIDEIENNLEINEEPTIENDNSNELVLEVDNIIQEMVEQEKKENPNKFVEFDKEDDDDLQQKIQNFATNRLDRNYRDNIQKTIDKTLDDDRRGSAIDNRSKVLDIRDDDNTTPVNKFRRNFVDFDDESNPFNRKKEEPARDGFRGFGRDALKVEVNDDPEEVEEDDEPYNYERPPINLITTESVDLSTLSENVAEKRVLLEDALQNFGVPAKVQSVVVGPAVTRYELEMPVGISVSKIKNKADDMALALAAEGDIRIEAPIPGRNVVGIEVPNNRIATISLKDILLSNEFKSASSPLTFALGKDITGKIITCDMQKLTHLLIAGTTGSGKSVCLNSIILSIIYKSSPEDVRIVLVDPKKVEFSNYEGLPHLVQPSIISDTQKAINALTWAVDEMERRFELLGEHRVKNIDEYNHIPDVLNGNTKKMPYLVIIIDELADLMMTGKKDIEEKIIRIAQKARAAGIHLILATQKPVRDVLTGLIKGNCPSRISFSVTSSTDSLVILDRVGAEKLLGKGDMLYMPIGAQEPKRIQACFISTNEINDIVDYVKENNKPIFDKKIEDAINNPNKGQGDMTNRHQEMDPLLPQALKVCIEYGQASATYLRRKFAIGYPKAMKIIDQMEEAGYISSGEGVNGSKGRTIYITMDQFREIFGDQFD